MLPRVSESLLTMNIRNSILLMLFVPFVGCTDTAPLPTANSRSEASTALQPKTSSRNLVQDDAPQQKTVVTLTDAAVAMVLQFQRQDNNPYLRVAVKNGGPTGLIYDLQLDDQFSSSDDYLDESHGLKVVVDKKSALYIDGTSIDWRVTETGQEGFHFTNPNAKKQ